MEIILWNVAQSLVLSIKKREKIAGLWEKETSYPEDRGSPTVTAMSSWINLLKLTSVQPCPWAGYTRYLLLTSEKVAPSPLEQP